MTQEIKLTSQEAAEMICKQLIEEGFTMNKVNVDWNADLHGGQLIFTGVTITIEE
jgi:hypothetical protein